MSQTNSKAHTAARRPYLSFRPASSDQERRIRRLAEATGKSIGQIIKECLEGHLPKLEAAS